ncbi:MAG: hypothetical protein JSV22_09995 [Bacteroidales bacterium]|nr:MAG: hypothetical protein JSV22_09995 [Bacteroidales bacterium]
MLTGFLKIIHYSLPPQVQIIYMFLVNLARKLRCFILPVSIYTGREKSGGLPLKIACLGRDKKVYNYWTERLINEKKLIQSKKKVFAWSAYKYLSKNKEDHDLAIIEMNSLTTRFAKPDTGFVLPRWFEMQLDFERAHSKMKKRGIIKTIKRYSITCEKKYSVGDLRYFYERMYVPYITKRYEHSAIIPDFRYYLNLFRRKSSQLLFIKKDDEYVAGVLDEIKGGKIRISAAGILDGREDIMRMGISGAIYYFEMINYFEKGIKSANIGGSSPLLTDGLTQFKLRIGGVAADDKYLGDQALWFTSFNNTEAIKNMLKTNPFIYKLKDGFYRAVFVDSEDYSDRKEFMRILNYSNCLNIKGTKIFCFRGEDLISEWLKEPGCENIDVVSFN